MAETWPERGNNFVCEQVKYGFGVFKLTLTVLYTVVEKGHGKR